jgi:hypothetical protein
MARTTITPTTIPAISSNGYNLTDSSDFEVLSTGSGNGVDFAYDSKDVVILKNTTGGAATFTIVLPSFTQITGVGGSVTDPTVTVAAGKTHILQVPSVCKQSDGKIYIDCDVAGSVLVLNMT